MAHGVENAAVKRAAHVHEHAVHVENDQLRSELHHSSSMACSSDARLRGRAHGDADETVAAEFAGAVAQQNVRAWPGAAPGGCRPDRNRPAENWRRWEIRARPAPAGPARAARRLSLIWRDVAIQESTVVHGRFRGHQSSRVYRKRGAGAAHGVGQFGAGEQRAQAQAGEAHGLGKCARDDQIGAAANPRQHGDAGEFVVGLVHQHQRARRGIEDARERLLVEQRRRRIIRIGQTQQARRARAARAGLLPAGSACRRRNARWRCARRRFRRRSDTW